MVFLEKLNKYLNQMLVWVAGFFVVIMVFLTCANVFLRIVWKPVPGTFELMGYFGAVAMTFALGFTQIKKGHIAVDLFIQNFPKVKKEILEAINCLICMLFFFLVSWQLTKYANTLLSTGEVTETLRIAYYPFTYGAALGCATLSLVFFVDLIKTTYNLLSKGNIR
jgi:TRAP-type C4-dicarboxylate transport system permease small subunit